MLAPTCRQNHPASAGTGLRTLIQQSVDMTNELLALCDYHVDDRKKTLSMSKNFPRLCNLGRSDLIIPLRESLTASLPPTSSSQSQHQPFPLNVPTFEGLESFLFHRQILNMKFRNFR